MEHVVVVYLVGNVFVSDLLLAGIFVHYVACLIVQGEVYVLADIAVESSR